LQRFVEAMRMLPKGTEEVLSGCLREGVKERLTAEEVWEMGKWENNVKLPILDADGRRKGS